MEATCQKVCRGTKRPGCRKRQPWGTGAVDKRTRPYSQPSASLPPQTRRHLSHASLSSSLMSKSATALCLAWPGRRTGHPGDLLGGCSSRLLVEGHGVERSPLLSSPRSSRTLEELSVQLNRVGTSVAVA